jgi:hypothetical protein
VADFAPAVTGNGNNGRKEQPDRRQDGESQAGTGGDERRQEYEREAKYSR